MTTPTSPQYSALADKIEIAADEQFGREGSHATLLYEAATALRTAEALEQRVRELTDTSLTAYWKREAERREDWRPLVQPQVDAAVAIAVAKAEADCTAWANNYRELQDKFAKAREGANEQAAQLAEAWDYPLLAAEIRSLRSRTPQA